jgi:O-antigen/teichoic acid export membrane protein
METPTPTATIGPPTGTSLARGFSWIWSGTLLGQAAWFGSLVLLGSLLPPHAFGAVAIGTFIVNAAALVQDAGSRGAIVLTRRLRAVDVARTVCINLGVGVVCVAVVWLTAGSIVSRFDAGADPRVLQILILSVAVRALAIAPMAVLQRTMKFKQQGSVLASSMLIAAVVSVLAALAGAGVWALVIRQLVAATLLPLLAWIAAVKPLKAELAAPAREWGPERRKGAVWFFLLAATDFIALSVDALVVGHSRGAAELGLYSLAFTLAFAPLTNFAWQIGKVLFPAAASTADVAVVAHRMLRTTRLTATVLLPLLPPTLVLAPVILPGVLGPEWKPMVLPFQILVSVAIGHAILVALGDSLSGIGVIGWRARLHVWWALGMVCALLVLVPAMGITGAALAHALLFIPFALAYVMRGTTFLRVRPGQFVRSLVDISVLFGAQLVVTVGVWSLLSIVLSQAFSSFIAASLGVVAIVLLAPRVAPEISVQCVDLVRRLTARSASREATTPR